MSTLEAQTADPHAQVEPIGAGDGPGDSPAAGAVGTRPTFTVTDAAAACAVSRKTITRKLPELAGHGAAKDDDGVWRIPVEALLAVGLHPGRSLTPNRTPNPTPTPPQTQTPAGTVRPSGATIVLPSTAETVTIPRDRWDDIRIRLARAEAEAAERSLALADARLALRALTAAPPRPAEVPPATTAAAPMPALHADDRLIQRRRRWWHRRDRFEAAG